GKRQCDVESLFQQTVKAFASGRTPLRNRRRCLGSKRQLYMTAYGLFATTCGAVFWTSSCALTFWICAACSFNCAVNTSMPFCCCATVFCNCSTLLCSLRNSFSNIALTCS